MAKPRAAGTRQDDDDDDLREGWMRDAWLTKYPLSRAHPSDYHCGVHIYTYINRCVRVCAIRLVSFPRGYYAGASTCDGIAVTAYDSIQEDYVLDNVCLAQT